MRTLARVGCTLYTDHQRQAFMTTTHTDPMVIECAQKIVQHLERHIVKNRHVPEVANRMSTMNKYIQVNFLLN